ncbi:hypothetical protein [Pseudomonas sp. TMB3-21]
MDTDDGVDKDEFREPTAESDSSGIAVQQEADEIPKIEGSISEAQLSATSLGRTRLTLTGGGDARRLDLDLEFWWEVNFTFHCRAHGYRLANNGRGSGNIYLGIDSHDSTGLPEITRDDARQDGNWHGISAKFVATGNRNTGKGNIYCVWTYDTSGNDPHFSMPRYPVPAPPPTIISPVRNVAEPTFQILGKGAFFPVAAPAMEIHTPSGKLKNASINSATGDWNATVSIPTGQSSMTYFGLQAFSSTFHHKTANASAYLAKITNPDTVVRAEDFIFKGTAAPGSKIAVVQADSHWTAFAGPATANSSGIWTAAANAVLSSRVITVQAQYTLAGTQLGYTKPVTFQILGKPAISNMATLQEMIFNVTGSNGFSAATLAVYIDPTATKVGETTLQATGNWSVPVNCNPGAVNLAVEQVLSGVKSNRGAVRSFHIRPPKPTLAAKLNGEAVELHGTGHNGLNVRMDVHFSGIKDDAYLEIPVNAGKWSKNIPADLLPGNYVFGGRQSVPDGGTGRIFNSGWATEIRVNVPTPKPTGVSATAAGQKVTFEGTGRQWDATEVKIGIYHNGVALAGVPQAIVQQNNSWQTPPGADLPPGTYPSLTARQWVNNQWSADSSIFSMVIESPVPQFTNPPIESPTGQRPQISGSAWPGSKIELCISGKQPQELSATLGTFVLNATEDWAPATYTLTATAEFGGQDSAIATRTFTVGTPLPVISTPAGAEVDPVPVLEGTGYKGCWVFVFSVDGNQELGRAQVRQDGKWSVTLLEQVPKELDLYAVQKEAPDSDNVSAHSTSKKFTVRVPIPVFSLPAENGRPGRTSQFSGTAMPRGKVQLWIKGENQPRVKDIPVTPEGRWEATVSLDVGGPVVLEVALFYKNFNSARRERVVTVVPSVPVIDTPLPNEALGAMLRISGFGYPLDTIKIQRRHNYSNLGSATVSAQGTWSYLIKHNMVAQDGLSASAFAGGGLESTLTPVMGVTLLGPAPQIIEPMAGDRVGLRPRYSGLATSGATVSVASGFNVDERLAPSAVADAYGRWEVMGDKNLPEGAAWVMVRQTVEGGASEWVESGRFMVEKVAAGFEAPQVDYPVEGQKVGRHPMFKGRGMPAAQITITKANDVNVVLAKPWVDRDGLWSARSAIELPFGNEYRYSVSQARDGVQSQYLSPHPSFDVVQVSAGFEAPLIDTPINDPEQKLERRPIFAGRGWPGAEIVLYLNFTGGVIASTQVDAQGRWSVRLSIELTVTDDPHRIGAVQTIDGQRSLKSENVGFKVEEKVEAPVILNPADGGYVAPRAVISGTAVPGAHVIVYQSGISTVAWAEGIADESGNWLMITKVLPLGDFAVTGQARNGVIISEMSTPVNLKVIDAG